MFRHVAVVFVVVVTMAVAACSSGGVSWADLVADGPALPDECAAALDSWAQGAASESAAFLTGLADPAARDAQRWWMYPLSVRRAPQAFAGPDRSVAADRTRLVAISLLYAEYLNGVVGIDRPGVLTDRQEVVDDTCTDVDPVVRHDHLAVAIMTAAEQLDASESVIVVESLVGLRCADAEWRAATFGGTSSLAASRTCPAVAEHLKAAGRPLAPPDQ